MTPLRSSTFLAVDITGARLGVDDDEAGLHGPGATRIGEVAAQRVARVRKAFRVHELVQEVLSRTWAFKVSTIRTNVTSDFTAGDLGCVSHLLRPPSLTTR
jgi:hypothetical protein